MAGGSADIYASPDGGWGWVVTGGCFCCLLFTPGLSEAFGIFFLEFRRYFQADAAAISWIASIMMSMTFFASPVAAGLSNKFGCRPVVFVGGILSSCGLLLSSFATSVFFLYFSFGILVGFSYGLVFIPSIVLVSYYFKKRHAMANGLAFSGSAMGVMIFPPLCHFLIEHYGWRGALIFLAGLNSNICVFASLFRPPPLKKTPRKLRAEQDPMLTDKSMGEAEQKKKILDVKLFKESYTFSLICLLLFLLGFSTFIPLIHLIPRAVYSGIPHGKASLLVSIIGLAGFVGRILHGVIINAGILTPYRMFQIAVLISGIASLLSPFGNTYMLLMAYAAVYGFTSGCYNPLVAVIMKEVVGEEKLPTAVGFSMLILGLGHLIGSPIAGKLFDMSGAYKLSFWAAGVGFLLVVFLSFARGCLENMQANKEANVRLKELESTTSNGKGNEVRMVPDDRWLEEDGDESNV
ncbi:monocarboxylate transporter 12-like [Glandiceps talaboti]